MAKTNQRHSLKDPASGKYLSKKPKWDAPGSKGFFAWLSQVKARILTDKGTYEPIQLEDWQREIITDILSLDSDGFRKYNFCLLCWAKRHSKSIPA